MILNDIFLQSGAGDKYLVISESDRTWILPVNQLKEALEFYQPLGKSERSAK